MHSIETVIQKVKNLWLKQLDKDAMICNWIVLIGDKL